MQGHSVRGRVFVYAVCLWSLLLLGIFSPEPLHAQEAPIVSVKFVLVPETKACKPDGYSIGVQSTCETLRRPDIDSWINESEYIHMTQSLSSEKVSLNEKMFGFLRDYQWGSKEDPKKRWTIVMLFEWKHPQSGSIELQRNVPPEVENAEKIRNYTWSGELNKEYGWINHQGAAAFIPSHNIRWTLRLEGTTQWTFKITGPAQEGEIIDESTTHRP
ncbi:hypothetical protein GF339_02310 [candidate division KSB3 bacterium]|uniref:Uncharacterized protein n=1 Tax=candidate division KSB3 bacterium TaxID=2044937 RepID=A0A9D5Q4Y4_9BACT|nr:hypothetical protein [candidate division KSB3 bacterium]MBD3323386.1 hypothetical protein [candidate division KSB3 bacterium]